MYHALAHWAGMLQNGLAWLAASRVVRDEKPLLPRAFTAASIEIQSEQSGYCPNRSQRNACASAVIAA
jgi:hypothetical protein